jgi:hypothetical protein
MNRRQFIAGACALCASPAASRAQSATRGCTKGIPEISSLVDTGAVAQGRAFEAVPIPPSVSEKFRGSGDADFDKALSVTLLSISKEFSVLPGFIFSEHVPDNAFASPKKVLGRDDGSVVFGNSLYRTIMQQPEYPEIGIVTVCAHEFAHIVQFKTGIYDNLVVGDRVKRLELHADFMSGFYAGRRKLLKPDYPAALFAATLYGLGDTNYNSPTHHGTSKERGDAVVAGFDSAFRARDDFGAGLETGMRYVKQISL